MIMNKLIALLPIAFVVACPARAIAQNNLENDRAYLAIEKAIDIKTIKPEVNINLPKFLLKDALADLDGGKNDPFAGTGINISDLIQDIKLIRVMVISGNKSNSEAIATGVAKLKATLDEKWTAIAVVGDGNEKVGVYAMSDPSGEAIAGLAVLVHEGRGDTVIANVVGRVSVGKLITAASKMHKFPKDLIKKLTKGMEAGEGDGGSEEKPSGEKAKEAGEKPAN